MGLLIHRAFEQGLTVIVTEIFDRTPRRVVKVKQRLGVVYFSCTQEGWTGMQHVSSIDILPAEKK